MSSFLGLLYPDPGGPKTYGSDGSGSASRDKRKKQETTKNEKTTSHLLALFKVSGLPRLPDRLADEPEAGTELLALPGICGLTSRVAQGQDHYPGINSCSTNYGTHSTGRR